MNEECDCNSMHTNIHAYILMDGQIYANDDGADDDADDEDDDDDDDDDGDADDDNGDDDVDDDRGRMHTGSYLTWCFVRIPSTDPRSRCTHGNGSESLPTS